MPPGEPTHIICLSGATDEFFLENVLLSFNFLEFRPFSLLSGGLRTRLYDRTGTRAVSKASQGSSQQSGNKVIEKGEEKIHIKKGVSRNDCKKTVEKAWLVLFTM